MGLHAHIGSQVFEASFFELAVEVLAPFVERHGLPELSLGGGLGVAYMEGEVAPSLTEWGAAVHHACAEAGITAAVTAWVDPFWGLLGGGLAEIGRGQLLALLQRRADSRRPG